MSLAQNTGTFPIPSIPRSHAAISMAITPELPRVGPAPEFGAANSTSFEVAGSSGEARALGGGAEYFDESVVAQEIRNTILRYFAKAQIAEARTRGTGVSIVHMDARLITDQELSTEATYQRFDALTGELAARLTPRMRRFVDVDLSFG